MEERNIKVTISKAREWYNSENSTLKELALQAFSKEELEVPTFTEMVEDLLRYKCLYNLTAAQIHQLQALKTRSKGNVSSQKILRVLALYFNKDWHKTTQNEGYFLTKRDWPCGYCGASNTLGNDWTIVKHSSVCYPIPYFKNEASCRKAFNILKDAGKLDGLYSDL